MLTKDELVIEITRLKMQFQKNAMIRFQDLHRVLDLIQGVGMEAIVDPNDGPLGSLISEEINYTGSQVFTTTNYFAQIYSIEVTGVGAISKSQYSIISNNQFVINDPLESGDFIVVIYSKSATTNTLPYYTQVDIDLLLSTKEDKNKKGVVNGYASLDNTGKVPISQLPPLGPTSDPLKEDKTNKQNSLTIDGTGTKYPTVDAVNAGISAIPIIADATTTTKGKLKLAGDLAGTADAPTVPGLTLKENISNKNIANGYAGLDSAGKVPVAQLPNSVMEYQGVYNASTNTPTLVNGTGNTGDVYRCSVAGAGVNSLNFVIGDYAIYNGTTWEKSHSGADVISSVFGRTGAIIATSGDYDTSLIADTSNKRYQTDNQKLFNDATSSIQTQLNNIPVNYAKVVYVNATTPATATIFDLNNPPTVNDNSLKVDVNNLYIANDTSTWVYNSTTSTYITKAVTPTTIVSNVQSGTTYTLLSSDNGKQIITTNSAAVTITIPTGLLSGFNCEVLQQGTGQVSFTTSGTTLHYSTFELPSIVERYGIVGIDNIPNVTNEFNIYGKLTSI